MSDGQRTGENRLRKFHAARWDEPVVMELGYPGRRGQIFPEADPAIRKAVGEASKLVPAGLARRRPPKLPELSEPEVQRHYLHLSQETLGMMGISLFGTCTMKYNPRLSEAVAQRPELAELHDHGLVPAGGVELAQAVLCGHLPTTSFSALTRRSISSLSWVSATA